MADTQDRPHGYTRKCVDKNILHAIHEGVIDPDMHSANITGLRRVADRIDSEGLECPVSLYSTFLSYLRAMDLTPDSTQEVKEEKGASKLDEIRARATKFN